MRAAAEEAEETAERVLRLLPHALQARGADAVQRDDPALYTRLRHQLPHYQHSLPPVSEDSNQAAGEEWLAVSWGHYAHAARKMAQSLLSLHQASIDEHGSNGDRLPRLALFANVSPEYMALHMACLSSGVVLITLPATASADELSAMLKHSQAHYIFVDSREQLHKVGDRNTIDMLGGIIYLQRSTDGIKSEKSKTQDIDALSDHRNEKIILWRDFLRLSSRADQELLNKQMSQLQGGDLASVVYSSGHSSEGMMYSHENLVWTAGQCAQTMQLNDRDIHVSLLPISHITEQLLSIYCHILVGHRVYLSSQNRDLVLHDLRSVQPTRLFASASFWKALHAALHEHYENEVCLPPIVSKVTAELESIAKRSQERDESSSSEDDESEEDEKSKEERSPSRSSWKSSRGGKEKRENPAFTIGRCRSESELNSPTKKKLNAKDVAKNVLLHDLYMQRMGLARLHAGYSTFAPLPAKIIKFFRKLRIPIYELYAHPYATGFISCNQSKQLSAGEEDDESDIEDDETVGTVGSPPADSRVKLDPKESDDNSEILVRGKNVFLGLLNGEKDNPTIVSNGWVRTGDLGTLNDDGLIKLKGRREEIFCLKDSEQPILPWKVEKLLKSSPIIEEAVVLGDNREYVTALLSLSSLSRVLSQQDRSAAIRNIVISANGKLDESCAIKKIATISPSTKLAHNQWCTTQYGRIIRSALPKHFAKELSALYPDDAELVAAAKEEQESSVSSAEEESSESEEEEEEQESSPAVREVEQERSQDQEHTTSTDEEHLEVKAPQETLEQIRVKPDDGTEENDDKLESQWRSGKEGIRTTSTEGSRSRALTIGESRTNPQQVEPTDGRTPHHKPEHMESLAKEEAEIRPEVVTEATARSVIALKAEDKILNTGGNWSVPDKMAPELALSDLSEEIVVYLLSFLDPPELGSVALTCRRFRAALEDEVLWKLLLQRTYGTGGLLVSKYLPITYSGFGVPGNSKELKAVDWRNTFINRAKLWKSHRREEPIERLALCAKWGAVPLLRQVISQGQSSQRELGAAEEWMKEVLNKKTLIGGKTVLHWACEHGNSGVVEHLVSRYRQLLDLNAKADIASLSLWPSKNHPARVQHFPLSLASASGHLNLVQYLLEQEEVRSKCGVAEVLYCLIAAADKQHETVVKFFLDMLHRLESNNGAATTPKEREETRKLIFSAKLWALELACERADLRIVRDLITSGGIYLNLDLPDEDSDEEEPRSSPPSNEDDDSHQAMVRQFCGLFRACEKGSIKIATSLLDCGLPVNMREVSADAAQTTNTSQAEQAQRAKGWTALHYAAKRGDLPLIQKLVARGADPSLRAFFSGRLAAPLDVAETMDRSDAVVRYLRKITPRRALYEQPEFVLAAAGTFVIAAILFLLSQLFA